MYQVCEADKFFLLICLQLFTNFAYCLYPYCSRSLPQGHKVTKYVDMCYIHTATFFPNCSFPATLEVRKFSYVDFPSLKQLSTSLFRFLINRIYHTHMITCMCSCGVTPGSGRWSSSHLISS